MASQETRWLREHYRPAPSDGPSAKRVKYSEIYDGLVSSFPSKKFDYSSVSLVIHTTFPNTKSKLCGHSRTKHILGIEPIPEEDSTVALIMENERLQSQVHELLQQVSHLEKQVHDLKSRPSLSPSMLSLELDSILSSSHSVYHGPDTIVHFNDFSIDGIIKEFQEHTPQLWKLVKIIGQVDRHLSDNGEEDSPDVMKAVVSLCTLIKCRSKKVLGLQLLISLMLIARATNRRVRAV